MSWLFALLLVWRLRVGSIEAVGCSANHKIDEMLTFLLVLGRYMHSYIEVNNIREGHLLICKVFIYDALLFDGAYLEIRTTQVIN